jgi:NAD(P)-dependent dehydrogenase (short-subunit alcohol dehydrogenase family)
VASDGARVAIVTGGAGGLGRVIAQRLRADGFRVAAADLAGPDGGAGAEGMAVRVDVTQPESTEAMCAEVHGRWGRIDVLVNNAGIAGPTSPVVRYPPDAWARVIAFTKSVAKEVARTGVLVNCIVPGVIDAGLTDSAPASERQLFLSRIPMGRMGRPGEVAELASWLASQRCSFSTGAAFDLSGGRAVY